MMMMMIDDWRERVSSSHPGARFRHTTLLLCPAVCVPCAVQEGYELEVGIVNNAVKACCRAGRPSEAEAVLAKSLERGLVPEVRFRF